MTISEIMCKMIDKCDKNHRDINHLLKVHSYARTIAKCEKISEKKRKTLEIAAIVHDISCPLCRAKYGNTDGSNQEKESEVLVRDFLSDCDLPHNMVDRIVYLVCHHHTLTNIDDIDYQILIEADYLVNADESAYSRDNIINMMNKVFKTKTGIKLLQSIYQI